jgi:hypothetical protein
MRRVSNIVVEIVLLRRHLARWLWWWTGGG